MGLLSRVERQDCERFPPIRMDRSPLALQFFTCGILALSGLTGSSAAAEAEKLVPARFNASTDARGNRWDVTQMGVVNDGTNDCFDGGAALQIDGSQLQLNRPMMTPDGKEFVLSGRYRGIGVTRRVRLDSENSTLRYLEIFDNPSGAAQQLRINIHTDLGGQAVQVVDFKDKFFAGTLGKGDPGFVTMGQDSRPGVVFLVAAPNAKEKPIVRINNNRAIDVGYTLNVPANGSVAIVHYLAQRSGAITSVAV
jgi:hypothetical protein